MELILGGAYQGKLTWAVSHYQLAQNELADLAQGIPADPARCCYHLEALTWETAKAGGSAEDLYAQLRPLFSNAVVISREIGAGVVPMDATQRLWRELHGAVLQQLAKQAGHVVRIFCGLPEVLK